MSFICIPVSNEILLHFSTHEMKIISLLLSIHDPCEFG